ncbi:MAG TPA: sigma-70 region 4 domain-containing protein, partial [Blastocatellia bacterium]|nr:sigma-70 region 4 domain-containing protein [Blastocatellia bacterium]
RRTRTWRTISERFAAVLTRKKEDQDDRLHGTDDSPLLKRLLAQLPEHQRAALLLRELEEMSYQEIAKVLSVSESKVKVDIHRARIALRTNARKQFDSRSSTTVLAQQTRARRTRRSRE